MAETKLGNYKVTHRVNIKFSSKIIIIVICRC